MALICDGLPLDKWTIPWNSYGPYEVDGWHTSFNNGTNKAYRVVGKHGPQLHGQNGCVIIANEEYAHKLASAANDGLLQKDKEVVVNEHRVPRE